MNTLQTFSFGDKQVRVVMINNNPWWIARDVCEVLGIIWKGYGTLGPLEQDEILTTPIGTDGGTQALYSISESGLYTLIMRSNKPEAKVFRKWVTGVVLPQIRKTGSYSLQKQLPQSYADALRALASEVEEHEKSKAVIAQQAPKVEAFDTFLDATNTQTITDCAKILGIGRQHLFDYLRFSGIFYQHEGKAIQRYVDNGYFEHIDVTIKNESTGYKKNRIQVRVTPKGIEFIRKHIEMDGGIDAVIALVRANRKKAA